MKKTMTPSKEDYLEAILILINEEGACRVTDLAEQLGFSKASASTALHKLEEEGYIRREDWRILLSEKGRAIAEQVYEKHLFFRNWFRSIGVSEETAQKDACGIEHILSDETYEKIKAFLAASDVRDN